MKKIKIIIPYFGEFPKFFPYFLMTARRNKNIDFEIFTDQPVEQFSLLNARNIHFNRVTFSDLKKKIQSKFNFEISLDDPYKLCDYKPAYGLIFEDELIGYDYWGFCDTDILLGDIYQFLEDYEFFTKEYDRYGLLGHLQIYKNIKEVNTIFKTGVGMSYRLDYQNVYTSSKNFIFDEQEGVQKLFELSRMNQLQVTCFHDLDISCFSFRCNGEKKVQRYYYWTDLKGLESIELKKGNIVTTQPLYVHFQKRNIECPEVVENKQFYVVPNRLVNGNKLSVEEIKSVTQNKIYWEHIKRVIQKKFKKEKWTFEFILHKIRMKNR